jgi:hypothetical protein
MALSERVLLTAVRSAKNISSTWELLPVQEPFLPVRQRVVRLNFRLRALVPLLPGDLLAERLPVERRPRTSPG